MMSEKRFHQFGLWVIDNPNFNGISIADLVDTELMSITEVVNLLNEQQATISALKEENEQLRKELNGKDCRKCGNYCRDKALDYCLVDEREPVYFSPLEWDYKAEAEKCKYYYR